MIEFSKNIDKELAAKAAAKRTEHNIRNEYASMIGSNIDYNMQSDNKSKPVQVGNEMLGAVVAEEDKIEKPKPEIDDRKMRDKYDKSKELGDFYISDRNIELTK